jgi:hypothetical protein
MIDASCIRYESRTGTNKELSDGEKEEKSLHTITVRGKHIEGT